ncbi:Pentapeptide repeat-containing protein [Streptomyces sp. 3213]|uniref:pentapeptide repeat-containing protein n=1 Tax=Streptomyces sp. 3213.3 TaxID=1855348 RepID=UPI00089CC13C|nr:pentapeptide repeat-containing protein [Streptomyces sp. 3213.3]SED69472.1 Pentapeptide repeat-containing protein [Streptomyces sp. 3213] [Streptomyces sp. 3213.3]
MTTSQASSSTRLEWHHCGDGADDSDPTGCRGVRVAGYERCLAHLSEEAREAYISSLGRGHDVDHRGTRFSRELLAQVLAAVDDGAGRAYFRNAQFDEAVFEEEVDFSKATFYGASAFRRAHFKGKAGFSEADFRDSSSFRGAIFEATAHFTRAEFSRAARFGGVQFKGYAAFGNLKFRSIARFEKAKFLNSATFVRTVFSHEAQFEAASFARSVRFSEAIFTKQADFSQVTFQDRTSFGGASFEGRVKFSGCSFVGQSEFNKAKFSSEVKFEGVNFRGDVSFVESLFEKLSHFGPVTCNGMVDLSFAVLESPVTLEIAASRLDCRRTRFEATATLRLRYSAVDLSDAVLGKPVSISASHGPFELAGGGTLQEKFGPNLSERVSINAVRGVDASQLVLTDLDLSRCRFSGAFNLDKLRIEGYSQFATTPRGIHRYFILPFQWTRRNAIAEEHYWRAASGRMATGWMEDSSGQAATRSVVPDDLAAIYRQLRKSLEDSKDEPGAADFYYGEMEARRKSRATSSRSEKALLSVYWLVSGYGLRASRSFVWLASVLTVSVISMMLWGLPSNPPRTITSGMYVGNSVTLSTIPEKPVLEKTTDKLTWRRFERSSRMVANSIAFRSSEQRLTAPGILVEFICRLLGPLLLALSILAIRGRVKR